MDLKHSHIDINRLYVMAMCLWCVSVCGPACAHLQVMLFPLQPDPVLLSDRLYRDKMLCMHKKGVITLLSETSIITHTDRDPASQTQSDEEYGQRIHCSTSGLMIPIVWAVNTLKL
jgi:hypothetical protein